MANNSLSTYTSTGISLSTAGLYQTPFTITQSGTVDVSSGAGVLSNVTGVVLLNEGGITAPAGNGVYFANGGTVTNASGGTITGTEGVRLGNAGGVVNPGFDSQSLANAGVITGTSDGVFVRGSVSSVINTGTISGGAGGTAMYFLGGGYIANSGTFAGNYGVHWVDDPAIALTFNNTGTVFASNIGLDAGGDGNQTITNQKVIYGGFTGVILSDGGTSRDTLINTGTILSQSFGVRTDTFGNAAIFNQGTIEDGIRLQDTATNTNFILNSGSINGAVGIDVYNSEGSQTIINRGVISGSSYGIRLGTSASSTTTIENAGTIAGAFGTAIGTQASNAGPLTLIIDPGAVFIGTVTGSYGVLEFAAGTGSLAGLGAQFFDFATFALDTGASWTVSGTLTSSADEVITGFTRHDSIDITNLTTPPDSLVTLSGSDVLSLEQGGDTLNLTFSGDSGMVLTLTSDGGLGTDITATNAICYVRGTRILTPTGEVPIESLRIGDALVTRFGGIRQIRWIGEQKYDWRFVRHNPDKIPVRIAPGALANGMPARELAISPGHSVLLGNTLVLARDLVNGVTILQGFDPARDTGKLEYFQIELESHDCVIAEGCWAETFADAPGLRAQFHNAASYAARYPDAPPPDELMLCAERPEHGPKLAAALLPVVARAWAGVTAGPHEGWFERCGDWQVEGWAIDHAHPALPVLLEVWLGERLLGTAVAHAARGDLAAAGKGLGRCAFHFISPVRLKPEDHRLLSIRRPLDGAQLPRLWERAA